LDDERGVVEAQNLKKLGWVVVHMLDTCGSACVIELGLVAGGNRLL